MQVTATAAGGHVLGAERRTGRPLKWKNLEKSGIAKWSGKMGEVRGNHSQFLEAYEGKHIE